MDLPGWMSQYNTPEWMLNASTPYGPLPGWNGVDRKACAALLHLRTAEVVAVEDRVTHPPLGATKNL